MALIRRFEEEAGRQYQRAKAGGFLHLAIGEEATIVGTTSVMDPDDYLIGTYRTHGHAIARGTDPKNVMAELFGREDGTARGRGGSMHIFDGDRRFMGGYGIVGGNLPIAAGLGLASDYKGTDEVTVCMFGDGATNTGNFGETMNLAALWSLPIVFLVENNLYGMGTSIERHSAVTDLSQAGAGLGVPGERVDGMDVVALRECVADHIEIARKDRRPTLVEAFTYRYRGHSAADPEIYREKEEVREWQQRDPIESFARRLIETGTITEADLARTREQVEAQVLERSSSPTPPRSRRSTRSTTTSTSSPATTRAGTRSTSGPRTRSGASANARPPSPTGSASCPRPAPPTAVRTRARGGSGEGPVTETDAPADQAQAEEEGGGEQSEPSRQQGPGGIE